MVVDPIQVDIEKALKRVCEVAHLEICDVSNGCGGSYSIVLVSEAFKGKSTLKRHRFVCEALKEQIAQMHAFSQKTYTPNEWDELGKKNGDAADESNKLGEIPSKLQLSAEL